MTIPYWLFLVVGQAIAAIAQIPESWISVHMIRKVKRWLQATGTSSAKTDTYLSIYIYTHIFGNRQNEQAISLYIYICVIMPCARGWSRSLLMEGAYLTDSHYSCEGSNLPNKNSVKTPASRDHVSCTPFFSLFV